MDGEMDRYRDTWMDKSRDADTKQSRRMDCATVFAPACLQGLPPLMVEVPAAHCLEDGAAARPLAPIGARMSARG